VRVGGCVRSYQPVDIAVSLGDGGTGALGDRPATGARIRENRFAVVEDRERCRVCRRDCTVSVPGTRRRQLGRVRRVRPSARRRVGSEDLDDEVVSETRPVRVREFNEIEPEALDGLSQSVGSVGVNEHRDVVVQSL